MQSGFVIVDKNRSGDVHRRHQHQPFFHPALFDQLFNLIGDVDIIPAMRGAEPEIFGERFHVTDCSSPKLRINLQF